MKKLKYYLLIALAMIGCKKEVIDVPSSEDNITLHLQCRSDEMPTRALTAEQDKVVKDINIYMYHKKNGEMKHIYNMSGGNVTLDIPKGEYDVYVVANLGYDMGVRTKSAIENFEVTINDEKEIERNSVLIMSGKQTINVVEDTDVFIELTRIVAKIRIYINTYLAEFELKSICLINAPKGCRVVQPNISLMGMKYAETQSDYVEYYMFENLQGVNSKIPSQQQKNKLTAPVKATYIQIIGSQDNYEIEYRIYIGENNTTDFNIHRNKIYIYMLEIKGINEVDTRVKAISLTQSAFNESYQLGEVATSNINIICSGEANQQYSIAYYLDEGNGTVSIDGSVMREGDFVPILNYGDIAKRAILTYVQNSASPVRMRVVYKDGDNFMFSRELITNYIPPVLSIANASSTESKGGGASTIDFTILKDGYKGKVQYKYEMLLGAGTIRKGSTMLTENSYTSGIIGKQTVLFTPTTPSNATIRITVLLESGETIYRNINIKVSKTTVTITRTNGSGVSLSVSDSKWLNNSTNKYLLPSDFGASINITLFRDWSSQYNRQIINQSIAPGSTLELRETSGAVSTWSGLMSESLNGMIATYRFNVSTVGTVGEFYTLVINK